MEENIRFSAGYVCGVLCSDGVVLWDERHSNYAVSLETADREFAELFSKHLTALIKKTPRVGVHRRRNVHMNIVTVYGRKTVEGLVSIWGLVYGKRSWSVPEKAWNDADFRKGFIMGYMDGNGSVHSYTVNKVKYRSIRAYSVNRRGLLELKDLLEMVGVKSLLFKAGKCSGLKIGGKSRMQAFMKRIGFGLNAKNRQAEKALLPLSLSESEDFM